jgi:hypothetical protein
VKGKFRSFKNKRLLLKNKELLIKLHQTIKKVNSFNFFLKNKIYKKFIDHNFSGIFRSLKGYSIVNGKRKAFYSSFQMTRFDIKKLTTYRSIVGLKSFV